MRLTPSLSSNIYPKGGDFMMHPSERKQFDVVPTARLAEVRNNLISHQMVLKDPDVHKYLDERIKYVEARMRRAGYAV
jgi:hypothetical protein